MTNAPEHLYEEVAFVAFHFHWRLEDILDLEHITRRRFVREIERLAPEGLTRVVPPPSSRSANRRAGSTTAGDRAIVRR